MTAAILSSETVKIRPVSGMPYSRAEHLARSLLLGRFDWNKRMAMYSAHFDESEHPDSGKHLIVAGCLASVEQWVHFEREWLEVISPFGATVFHAVDFERGKPPFDGINNSQKREIADRLAGIIVRRCERIFSFQLDLVRYRKMNEKWVFAESYGYPYPLCARSCIGGVEAWAGRYSIPMKDVLVFFEDGAKHKGQLEWIAERDGLNVPIFRKKTELVPLQAGDFMAWHFAQIADGKDRDGHSQSIIMRLERMSHSWRTMNLEDPDKMPTLLEIPPRLPEFNYRAKVFQKFGARRAVVQYWRKDTPSDEKIDRKALVLPDRKTMTDEQLVKRHPGI
jgi:hypothetical protein